MKRSTVIGFVIASLALSVSADLTKFRWYDTAAGNVLLDNYSTLAPAGCTVLTYLSTDGMINYPGGGGGMHPWYPLSHTMGDDVFYKALGMSLAGRLTTTYMTEGSNDYRGMYAYAIVLNMPLSVFNTTYRGNVANIPSGVGRDVTRMSTALANLDLEPPPTAQTFTAGKTLVLTVPEPATALLLGIGGMGAWMLRRSKLQAQQDEEADV